MERHLQQRIIGVTVVAIIFLIVIPFLFSGSKKTGYQINSDISLSQPASVQQSDSSNNYVPVEEVQPTLEIKPEKMQQPIKKSKTSSAKAAALTMHKMSSHPGNYKTVKKTVAHVNSVAHTAGKISKKQWVVQLASFSKENNAKLLQETLVANGYKAYIKKFKSKNKYFYKVFLGPLDDYKKAEKLVSKMQKAINLKGLVIKYEG